MKKILCFGDSNTWGYIPDSAKRYRENIRWTSLLQNLLGKDFKIIEAGCCNRTCFMDNPLGIEQTGYKVLEKYLNADFAKNPDLIIISLGINDIQKSYNPSLDEIKTGLEGLINLTKSICKKAKILVISPARLSNSVKTGYFKNQFDELSIEKSKHFAKIYEETAKDNDCLFFDWDKIVKVSDIDGLHFSPEAHKKIAYALYDFLCSNDF